MRKIVKDLEFAAEWEEDWAINCSGSHRKNRFGGRDDNLDFGLC